MSSTSRRSRKATRRSYRLAWLAVAALAIVSAAYLAFKRDDVAPARKPAPARNETRIFLDGRFGARFAGEMLAQQQGLFAQDGHTITVAEKASADFVEMVAREHAIGVTTGQKFLLAAWRGVPVVAFAASFLDTSVVILTLESSGLRRPADLVGKRVGVLRGGEGEVIFDAMMAQLGLPRSQITKVADRDNLEALRAGEVDAIITDIGARPMPTDTGMPRVNMIRPQEYAIHVPGQIYFASSDLVHDRPSIVGQALRAIIRGWQLAYGDYARSVPLIVGFDRAGLRADRVTFDLQQQRDLVSPTGMRIAEYDESRWRTLRDILMFAKLGEETVPLPQAVNYGFVRDVYRRSPDLEGPGAWPGNP
ncbi:ABC transporter substrate-binding protein [Bradyrhizobium sp. Ai1a-2]|uniref:ABC transporter substrate-binding protein n=1 Tax=Bradyrhizobium sp. Ai1a-2 TaxID=196490 RepID=UPI0003FE92B5|nr:ABC transporter substrate-binding protein [Bradyrhizobium sp. Ai1a-2]